jgi:putative DNA primase/helicase
MSADQIPWLPIAPSGVGLIRETVQRRWNECAAEFGTEQIKLRTQTRFHLQTGSEMLATRTLRWRVKRMLPEEGVAAVYGASGSGKSFLVLDLALALCRGSPWFGNRVHRCPVTYVCLEGAAGVSLRLKALGETVPEDLLFLTAPVNLLIAKDITDLVEAIRGAGAEGGVVVIDTLNRATPGADENSSVDMGHVIAGANAIQRGLGGLVLLVHHTGKDASKGLRGHSSLLAALDAAIEVRREGGTRSFSLAKAKDGNDGIEHHFTLNVVDLGIDDDGDPITSCRVRPAREAAKVKALSTLQRLGMDAFMSAAAQRIGKGDPSVHTSLEDWRTEFFRRSTAETTEGKRSLFSRVRRELVELGRLTVSDNVYRPTGSAPECFGPIPSRESGPSLDRV